MKFTSKRTHSNIAVQIYSKRHY